MLSLRNGVLPAKRFLRWDTRRLKGKKQSGLMFPARAALRVISLHTWGSGVGLARPSRITGGVPYDNAKNKMPHLALLRVPPQAT